MNNDTDKTAEKMNSVKSCCCAADAGPKKDAAMTHFHAADKAHESHNDAETNKHLDAATQALV